MEDNEIIELYWNRQEKAIEETAFKYDRYLHSIAYGILSNQEDAEECVNDTYHAAWQSIPPHRPDILSSFLGKITRRIAISRWRKMNTDKRGNGDVAIAYEELEECISGFSTVENEIENEELKGILDAFLRKLPISERRVFVGRYWRFESIEEIARRYGYSNSKVKSMLQRTRKKLGKCLEKEGYR